MDDRILTLCRCPGCRSPLTEREGALRCSGCGGIYPVTDGIPVLLPQHDDETRARYVASYERLATDDLATPIVPNRFELLHEPLIRFLGDLRGLTVLDVGAAHGSYLREVDAETKIALDIALPFLQDIPATSGIVRVCGDAEALPIALDSVDVVIISDVLEHLLEPRALVDRLSAELRPDARVFVHVPWEESLDQYESADYEFTHLRSFDEFSFRQLFWQFDVVRTQGSLPQIDTPIVFRLRRALPRGLYNLLVHVYFWSDLQRIEQRARERWIRELPRRTSLLRQFYAPAFQLFELRPARKSALRRALIRAANRSEARASGQGRWPVMGRVRRGYRPSSPAEGRR